MEKNGLNLNTEAGSLLSLANLAYNVAEKRSQDRIKYSKFLIEYSNEIDKAIKNKDIKQIFALEKDAQEYDYIMAKPQDKRRDSLSALQVLYDYWERCQDKNVVIRQFKKAHSGIGWATKPINDPIMKNGIQSQCRKISSIAGANKTPAEDLFYKKRQEALRLIEKEHIKMINEHLGLSKSKGLSL
ncbi:MAG: hypothetical protein K2O76_00980 [Mailhella sp.]|jgi:hypothetical protein|nr:hypothetical protein [Mailhella sp.]